MMDERQSVVDAAWALLMAAILLRDMAGAMPMNVFTTMPPDIRNRMLATYYQDTFDGLPADIQAEARQLILADPDVRAAREIDAHGG